MRWLSYILLLIALLSTPIAFPDSVRAAPFSQTIPFSGNAPPSGFSTSFAPSVNWLFNSFGHSISGSMTDGVDTAPISNANSGLSNDTFTDGRSTNEYISVSGVFGSYTIVPACPIGSVLYSEPGYGDYCYSNNSGFADILRNVGVKAGSDYTVPVACPIGSVLYSEPGYGDYCYSNNSGFADILRNVGVKAGSDYTVPVACPIGSVLYSEPGYGDYCYSNNSGFADILRNVGVSAPRSITYSGSISLTGDATSVRITTVPVNQDGGGSAMCPSGTYLYGVNTALVDARDTPYTKISKMFCASFQNPSIVDTSAGTRAVRFGNAEARCGGNEFTQGFYLSREEADGLEWNNVGGMFCGRLRSRVGQEDTITTPPRENLISMITGIFDMRIPVARAQPAGSVAMPNCNGCSATVGAGVENMVIGFGSRIDMGNHGKAGPRIQLNPMYTRPAPIGPTAELTADPSTIDSGQSSRLTWSSTNSTSCTAAGEFSTDGATNKLPPGVLVTPSVTSTYSITCTGPDGPPAQDLATVTVLVPTVSRFSAAPSRVVRDSRGNGSTIISWNATNVDDCIITRNGVTWQTLTSDASRTISNSVPDTVTGQTTYSISCTLGSGSNAASASDTQIVNTVSSFQEF